jgi:hypothetical protein
MKFKEFWDYWGDVLPCWGHSLVAIANTTLVVFGGVTRMTGSIVFLDRTLVIDLSTLNPGNKFVRISEVNVQGPSARSNHTCVAIENEMIL